MPTERIRVLHLVWRLTRTGGVPAVSRTVLSHLDPARFEAHALSVRPRLDDDELHRLGPHVAVHSLDFTGRNTRLARLGLTWRLARAIRAIDPDVVHLHSGSA